MKINVRIAVAANHAGEWNAYGWRGEQSWEDTMDSFEPLAGEHRFWIEADIEVPDTEQVVAGRSRAGKDE